VQVASRATLAATLVQVSANRPRCCSVGRRSRGRANGARADVGVDRWS
jgi:hypothetical protein